MTAKRKPLAEAPIDCIIRLLAQAAGIAKRKRMQESVRYYIARAMVEARYYANTLRARKRK